MSLLFIDTAIQHDMHYIESVLSSCTSDSRGARLVETAPTLASLQQHKDFCPTKSKRNFVSEWLRGLVLIRSSRRAWAIPLNYLITTNMWWALPAHQYRWGQIYHNVQIKMPFSCPAQPFAQNLQIQGHRDLGSLGFRRIHIGSKSVCDNTATPGLWTLILALLHSWLRPQLTPSWSAQPPCQPKRGDCSFFTNPSLDSSLILKAQLKPASHFGCEFSFNLMKLKYSWHTILY